MARTRRCANTNTRTVVLPVSSTTEHRKLVLQTAQLGKKIRSNHANAIVQSQLVFIIALCTHNELLIFLRSTNATPRSSHGIFGAFQRENTRRVPRCPNPLLCKSGPRLPIRSLVCESLLSLAFMATPRTLAAPPKPLLRHPRHSVTWAPMARALGKGVPTLAAK